MRIIRERLVKIRMLTEGFTLAELITVIWILAILALIGFVSFSEYFQDSKKSAIKANLKSTATVLATNSVVSWISPRSFIQSGAAYAVAGTAFGQALSMGSNYTVGRLDAAALRLDRDKFVDSMKNPFLVASVDVVETYDGKKRGKSYFQVAGEVSSGSYAVFGDYPVPQTGSDVLGLIQVPGTWGPLYSDASGDALPPLPPYPVQVDVGGSLLTCAVLSNGRVKCFGDNSSGQLGIGTVAAMSGPVEVFGISNAVKVSTSSTHACALLSEGSVKCWGSNSQGKLGTWTTFTGSAVPLAVSGISGAVDVASSTSHNCAVISDGTVKCWGWDAYGQLGNGAASPAAGTVVNAVGITNAVSVAARDINSCALLSDGSIKCWGYNAYWAIGDGTTTDRDSPTAVSGISNATQVSVDNHSACARLSDGNAKCWWSNSSWRLGNGNTVNQSSPVSVSGALSIAEIRLGVSSACAKTSGGALKCWGSNSTGQWGAGYAGGSSSVPVDAGTWMVNVTTFQLGNFGCAIEEKKLKCWGGGVYVPAVQNL